VGVVLQPAQRDALFRWAWGEVSDFGDLEEALAKGDFETAYRMGRRVADAFRLIQDGGLGWAHRIAEPVELTLPEAELRAIIQRLKGSAEASYEAMRPDQEEMRAEWEEVAGARDACTFVLEELKAPPPPPRP
jgi:hypothetical protein